MSAPFADPLKGFKATTPAGRHREEAVLSTPDWQGPLTLLIEMAQRRRIDLKAVSMLDLVNACLDSLSSFDRVEDKAEQLVLAADLTLMKSRLLIGAEDEREEEEEALRQQALKLDRIRRIAALLMSGDQLGREIWPRGAPEIDVGRAVAGADDLTIVDVIQAYARLRLRDEADERDCAFVEAFTWRSRRLPKTRTFSV